MWSRGEVTGAIVAAVMLVALVDLFAWRGRPGVAGWGALDFAAHAATGFLFVAAVVRKLTTGSVAAVVAASVLIDLDHLPAFLGSGVIQGTAPRPYPHSVAGLILVLLAARALRAPARTTVLIVSALALHFWRDMAEPDGPGLVLLWPLSHAVATVPYWLYAGTMLVLLSVALVRDRRPLDAVEEREVARADAIP